MNSGSTVTQSGAESVHPFALVTTSVAQYVPASGYVCDGFCKLLVLLLEPGSPKSHDQVAALVDASVNWITGSTLLTGLLELITATGIG